VFARLGIAETRVEDILAAANIARRTFYRYFSGKDEVLAALFAVWTAELVRAVEDARARSDDPLGGIRAGIDLYLGFYRSGPPVLRELVALAMSSTSPLAPRRRWLRGEVVRLLDQAVREHDGRKLDPLVYYGLLGALEGLSIELGDPKTTTGDVDRARVAIHAILDHTLGLPRPTPLPTRRGGPSP
jgi:AcrR family transcriptional regulator